MELDVGFAEVEQKIGESEVDYIKRLRESVEKQCTEIQDLIARNGIMAEALGKTNGIPVESLKRGLEEKSQLLELAKSEKVKLESKASMYRDISSQQESALNSALKVIVEFGDEEAPSSDENIGAEVTGEAAEKDSETEVNRLLVRLGQEQSKVERLSERVVELGGDVEELLKGIGDDSGLFEEEKDEENENNDPERVDEGEELEDFSKYFENEREENEDDDDGEKIEDEAEEENEDVDAELLDDGEKNDDDPGEENKDDEAELLDDVEKDEDDIELLEEEGEEVDNSGSNEDSSVESLLGRISNVDQPDDRKKAMDELVNILANSSDAVLAFGATGIPVVISVLKDERDDVEMVQSALGVLSNALTPIDFSELQKEEFQDALMYSDLFSSEADNISLLISLLEVDNFLAKIIPFNILSQLIRDFPNRLHEAVLNTPGAIIKFIDLISDSLVRMTAMRFLTNLTREAKEIQKVVVSEGAFEKIFGIIEEEEDGDGYMVEICLELLNSLLRENASNQMLLKQTIGFEPLLSILELQSVAGSFSEQKTSNVLAGLDAISILLTTESSEDDSEGDSSSLAIKTTLFQKNLLDHLLMLGVESHGAPVEIRCSALKCIGDLISGNLENCNALSRKVLGEEPKEPALNSILQTILTTSSTEEFIAADYIFKNFCEKNSKGQAMLASTSSEEEANKSFASMLLQGFALTVREGELKVCGRAAIVLSHILKDNNQCKEKVLGFNLEASSESLMLVLVKRLTVASSYANKPPNSYVKPALLKLLVVWLSDCPKAVKLLLDSHPNLSLLLDLLSDESESALTKGLAALVLGETLVYNDEDPFFVVRAIRRKFKVKLASYFPNLDAEKDEDDDPVVSSIFDALFATMIKTLEAEMSGKIKDLYSNPKSNEALVPAELDRKSGESESDYLQRLKEYSEKQYTQIQGLRTEKEAMSEDLAKSDGVPIETLVRDLHRTTQQLKLVRSENAKVLAEALMYREISDKLDVELVNVNSTFNGLKFEIPRSALPDIKAIKAKARENSLSVWLGQEQSRAEKLIAKLVELGENVDELIQGIIIA